MDRIRCAVMPIDCVVLDFDGTLTDVERHAPAFHRASRAVLAARIGVPLPVIESLWDEIDAEQGRSPAELGWNYHGLLVGPARGDPYLIANALVRAIVERCGAHGEPVADPTGIVLEVHRDSYAQITPPFRDDAAALMDGAVERGKHVWIVTNSGTESVSAKVDGLGLAHRERVMVRGSAQKFVVAPPAQPSALFDGLPEAMHLGGLRRPILLRRGRYFDVMQQIWQATGSSPASTLVAGDLFELDLAMPAALGCAVHLVTRRTTLAHERDAALAQGRGGAGDRLEGIIARLG